MSERKIGISLSNLFLIIATVLLSILIWQLRSLILILMIAIVIASTLAPIIDHAEKFKIPRWLGVILVYLGIIAILTGLVLLLGPTVIQQIQALVQKSPNYIEELKSIFTNLTVRFGMAEPENLSLIDRFFDIQAVISWTLRSSQRLLVRSLGLTRGFLGGVLNIILALLLSAYLLSGSKNLIQGFVSLFPKPWDERLAQQVKPISQRMGGYIQGRLLVSFILGVAISFGLRVVGISEFALGLGVIAGITNLIPFFGPVLGAIPALIVAVSFGGWTFLWTLLLFVIIQNIETYVLDPLLVGSSVKVTPLYQLLGVLSGVQLLGILGALIIPPWVAGASVVLENLYLKPKMEREKQMEIYN